MNNRTLQLLGFVVVALIAALLLVESGDDGVVFNAADTPVDDTVSLPDALPISIV